MSYATGRIIHSRVDRLLAVFASICALHCLIVPVAFAVVPSLTFALYAHANPGHGFAIGLLQLARFEWLAALIASSVAIGSSVTGFFTHRRPMPLALAVSGALSLFCVVLFAAIRDGLVTHTAFAVVGGTFLVAAHLYNRNVLLRNELVDYTRSHLSRRDIEV